MKFFKRILTAIIAVVMGCTAFLFAACGSKDSNSGQTPGGNNPGENTPGGNTPGETPTDPVVASFLNKLKAQKLDYMLLEATTNEESHSTTYYADSTGKKLKTEEEYTVVEENKTSVKINLSAGDFDGVNKNSSTRTVVGEEPTGTVNSLSYIFGRSFQLFSYEVEPPIKEVTDFTGLELEYAGSVLDGIMGGNSDSSNIGGSVGYALLDAAEGSVEGAGGASWSQYLSLAKELPVNYIVAALANEAGAITVNNGTVTVDLNKAAYKIVNDIKAVVNGWTKDTTIGDILNNATVKKYVSVFTELVPVAQVGTAIAMLPDVITLLMGIDFSNESDQIAATIISMGEQYAQYVAIAQALLKDADFAALTGVTPDTNSSTYDYIVKLLSSDELNAIVAKIIENMAQLGGNDQGATYSASPAPATETSPKLTDLTIETILAMVNANAEPGTEMTLKNIQDGYAQAVSGITENKISVVTSGSEEEGYTGNLDGKFELSNYKVSFKLDNSGNVTEETLSLKTASDYTNYWYKTQLEDESVAHVLNNYKSETTVEYVIKYVAEANQLVDISNNTAVVSRTPDYSHSTGDSGLYVNLEYKGEGENNYNVPYPELKVEITGVTEGNVQYSVSLVTYEHDEDTNKEIPNYTPLTVTNNSVTIEVTYGYYDETANEGNGGYVEKTTNLTASLTLQQNESYMREVTVTLQGEIAELSYQVTGRTWVYLSEPEYIKNTAKVSEILQQAA